MTSQSVGRRVVVASKGFIWKASRPRRLQATVAGNHLTQSEFRLLVYLKGREYGCWVQTSWPWNSLLSAYWCSCKPLDVIFICFNKQHKCCFLFCNLLSLYKWKSVTSFKGQSLEGGLPCIFQTIGNILQFSHSVVSDSLRPHEPRHVRPPCPSPTPGVHPNPWPSRRWCHPTISSSVVPFSSCPQSFPASGSFPMSQLFASGDQSIGVSASTSVLPSNTQDWSPLGWTGWILLQSKGLSRSSTP